MLNRSGELAGWSVVGSDDIEPVSFVELRVVLYRSPSNVELSHWAIAAMVDTNSYAHQVVGEGME